MGDIPKPSKMASISFGVMAFKWLELWSRRFCGGRLANSEEKVIDIFLEREFVSCTCGVRDCNQLVLFDLAFIRPTDI